MYLPDELECNPVEDQTSSSNATTLFKHHNRVRGAVEGVIHRALARESRKERKRVEEDGKSLVN